VAETIRRLLFIVGSQRPDFYESLRRTSAATTRCRWFSTADAASGAERRGVRSCASSVRPSGASTGIARRCASGLRRRRGPGARPAPARRARYAPVVTTGSARRGVPAHRLGKDLPSLNEGSRLDGPKPTTQPTVIPRCRARFSARFSTSEVVPLGDRVESQARALARG